MLNFILFVDLMMTCLFPQVDFHLGPRCWSLSCLWTWWWLVCSHRLIFILVLDAELYLVCGLDDDLFVPTGWFPSRSWMLNFILFVDLMMTCLFPQVDFHLGPRCWTLSCLWTWWWLVCSHRLLISISVLDAELYLVCGLDDDLFVPTGCWFPSRS